MVSSLLCPILAAVSVDALATIVDARRAVVSTLSNHRGGLEALQAYEDAIALHLTDRATTERRVLERLMSG